VYCDCLEDSLLLKTAMGNVMSEEEEQEFFSTGFDLDSPDADKVVNFGTSAPNCQPKHTAEELEEEEEELAMGQEVVMKDQENPEQMKDDKALPLTAKHRRDSNGSEEGQRGKRQHLNQQQKKLSYIQMAKMGYQELINAIIRPPRADYKVCASSYRRDLSHSMLTDARMIFYLS